MNQSNFSKKNKQLQCQKPIQRLSSGRNATSCCRTITKYFLRILSTIGCIFTLHPSTISEDPMWSSTTTTTATTTNRHKHQTKRCQVRSVQFSWGSQPVVVFGCPNDNVDDVGCGGGGVDNNDWDNFPLLFWLAAPVADDLSYTCTPGQDLCQWVWCIIVSLRMFDGVLKPTQLYPLHPCWVGIGLCASL